MNQIYFIQGIEGGLIKIGYAEYLNKRLERIQACSPVRLKILINFHGRSLKEELIHKQFSKYRQHNEWFEPAPEIIEYIESIKNL